MTFLQGSCTFSRFFEYSKRAGRSSFPLWSDCTPPPPQPAASAYTSLRRMGASLRLESLAVTPARLWERPRIGWFSTFVLPGHRALSDTHTAQFSRQLLIIVRASALLFSFCGLLAISGRRQPCTDEGYARCCRRVCCCARHNGDSNGGVFQSRNEVFEVRRSGGWGARSSHGVICTLPQAIGRLLHRMFGLIDLAPSDVFAGLVLVRARQKFASSHPRDRAKHIAGTDEKAKSEDTGRGSRPRSASSEGLLFVRSRRWRYVTEYSPPFSLSDPPPLFPRFSLLPSPDNAGGVSFLPDSAADRLALAEATRLMRFAFGIYGARGVTDVGASEPAAPPTLRGSPARVPSHSPSVLCWVPSQAGPLSCLPTPAAAAADWPTHGAEVRGGGARASCVITLRPPFSPGVPCGPNPLPRVRGDSCFACNQTALMRATGVEEADVLFASLTSRVALPAYAIIADHSCQTVSIVVRGTLSLEDCVTDALADSASLEDVAAKLGEAGNEWAAHAGILASARNLLRDIRERGILERVLPHRRPGGGAEEEASASAPLDEALMPQRALRTRHTLWA